MKTLTIRGVPDELRASLKARAKKNRRSLNQEVIAEFSVIRSGSPTDEAAGKRQRAQELIARVEEMREGGDLFHDYYRNR